MLKRLVCFNMIFTVMLGLLIYGSAQAKTEKPSYKVVEEYVAEHVKGENPGPGALQRDLFLKAARTDKAPEIDGRKDDIWQKAESIFAWDNIAKVNVQIKALYTSEKIFLLVEFVDPDESRMHKAWHWDRKEEMYVQGGEREDSFVFKWNMESGPAGLSIYADNNYTADIWFWKADRSDPVGYADDKSHVSSSEEIKKATRIITRTGKKRYLLRMGDEGEPTYYSTMPIEYKRDTMPRWQNRKPSGSRSDVRAKGNWENGRWTIEFARKLKTNHSDDVQFYVSQTYWFGISLSEIGGGIPRQELTNPLYGCGDVFNNITLSFSREQ